MASKVVMWIALCFFLASILCVNGETLTTSTPYDSAGRNYDLDGLFCATIDSNQTLEFRSEYLWTAYCDQAGQPMELSLCGTCIQVTNDSTDQNVIVRIVDECKNGGLVLETDAFNAIDKDGKGKHYGHMFTTYKLLKNDRVKCSRSQPCSKVHFLHDFEGALVKTL
ncbi:pathogenesis-related protein PR-4-like [Cryptomeria japonica]|uniref:pathogenesis-related protein PR-4-like n=1 Tax=Cryptomeria japonica TaxID=3369 RepID=UPI0027DA9B8A|nr:pathogenesis-related protein PR-4-like [Cryptomeria japonica]